MGCSLIILMIAIVIVMMMRLMMRLSVWLCFGSGVVVAEEGKKKRARR